MSDTATSAAHTAKTVGYEFVDVVIDYLVPLGSGLAGYAAGPGLIGGNQIGTYIFQSPNGIPSATETRVGGAIMALVTGLIGYVFWRLGKHDGWAMRLAGKAVGGFFLGTAASYAINNALAAQSVPSGGLLGSFQNGFIAIAGGT